MKLQVNGLGDVGEVGAEPSLGFHPLRDSHPRHTAILSSVPLGRRGLPPRPRGPLVRPYGPPAAGQVRSWRLNIIQLKDLNHSPTASSSWMGNLPLHNSDSQDLLA